MADLLPAASLTPEIRAGHPRRSIPGTFDTGDRDVHLFRLAVWTLSATMLFAASAQGATRTVCASGCMYTNLQPAIDAAQPGDTILLRAGETFIGNYVLKAKSGTAEIVIRSDAPATSLPAAGVRLVP